MEIIEMGGDSQRAVWNEYVASGMPSLIGGFHLCLALHALATTGMGRRLAERPVVAISDVIGDLDQHTAGHLIRYLTLRGVLHELDGDAVALTDRGARLQPDLAGC